MRTPLGHPDSDRSTVRGLFNAKAETWDQKYARGGPAEPRLWRFERCLREEVPPPARVLDLGCGTGNIAARLASAGYSVVGCDIAEDMIATARKVVGDAVALELLAPDWQRLPFETGSFDAVVASSLFEYVDSLDQVLRECFRVLRSPGRIVFTVPNVEHPVRLAESVLKPIVRKLPRAVVARSDGLQRLATYLDVSRNRMPIAAWRALGGLAGFDTDEQALVEGPEPLLMLVWAK